MDGSWQELPARTLTDGSATPKHAQLRAILQELCTSYFKPGDMLPGERILEETYGVSRITVRRAIGDLVASGYLRRARGKGTFVAYAPLVATQHLHSFSEVIRAQHMVPSAKILSAAWTPAPAEIAQFFASQDSAHSHICRLRLGDGDPIGIDDAWYNARFAPDLLEQPIHQSIYELLSTHYSTPIDHAEQTITAISATEDQAPLLQVAPGSALLQVTRLGYTGRCPIEWCVSYYRPDRYVLSTQLAPNTP